jgi:DNA-binding CsgD family transcriptional regulator
MATRPEPALRGDLLDPVPRPLLDRVATKERPAVLSAQLFSAGAAAGRPLPESGARWAMSAALAGDLDSALRLADRVIAEQRADRGEAALVAAAALAHRGQLAHSTELYRWSGAGPAASFATVGLIGTGHPAEVAGLPGTATVDGPPTLLAHGALLAARGIGDSVTGTPISALGTLVRAADLLLPAGSAVLLPDSPAALAALVALHYGELAVAESVLTRAIAAGLGGVLLAARHRLLLAWSLMVGGRTAAARQCLAAVRQAGRPLEARDQLFALALDAALARRDSDLAAHRRAWLGACELLMRHPVDLFMLLPLGELAVAAARLGAHGHLATHLAEADALLHRLGDPPLWTAPLHWSGLHAAIIAERPDLAAERAATLARFAHASGFHTALAAAAECWLAVLAGRIDAGRAQAAARGLHAAGLCWDGARLAAQAAIRTKDRKAMVVLLDCARQLQGRPTAERPGTASAAGQPHPAPGGAAASDHPRLSGRERQVAALVVAGLTYKQIGDRLFISPKTVEHHVARMRHRLDCGSRSDLLARLRDLVGADRPT